MKGADRAGVAIAVLLAVALFAWACGAATSPGSGELMFDFAAEDEDAGADSGRRPLPLDAGP